MKLTLIHEKLHQIEIGYSLSGAPHKARPNLIIIDTCKTLPLFSLHSFQSCHHRK